LNDGAGHEYIASMQDDHPASRFQPLGAGGGQATQAIETKDSQERLPRG
jgi:hypothetical protein